MSERELYRMTHPCTGHCLIWIYCYNELMSWSRNLKVMADLVPDFVPQHRPLMSFLIRRPESLCFNSWYTWEDKPWDAKSEKWNDWFKRNPPYGTLKRIIHLTHSHIHLRCMWTTSKSSTPRIGRGVFADIFFTQELAFTVDFVFVIRGIPISALILHYSRTKYLWYMALSSSHR